MMLTMNKIKSRTKTRKLLVVFMGVALAISSSYARKVSGYIITNNLDTIIGELQVTSFDLLTGGYIPKGINLEPMHHSVRFREPDKFWFQNFGHEEIQAFGFIDDSIDYYFKSFAISSKSIFPNERERKRFLTLIYVADVAVYRDIVRLQNFQDSFNRRLTHYQVADYTDYYLYTEKQGLSRVIRSKEYKNLKDLLRYYEFDADYLNELLPEVTFKDIGVVLRDYEIWKAERFTKTLEI